MRHFFYDFTLFFTPWVKEIKWKYHFSMNKMYTRFTFIFKWRRHLTLLDLASCLEQKEQTQKHKSVPIVSLSWFLSLVEWREKACSKEALNFNGVIQFICHLLDWCSAVNNPNNHNKMSLNNHNKMA